MAIVEENNIFCRVNPVQKDRIITLLKKNGHVVGYMGDGINDAPSLKTSDVGISVNNAVDVAKESADIILSQNDLTVLAQGVLEGRKTFGNTMKYIQLGVSSNFGNMFSVAGAAVFLPPGFLPMLPVQILLNNLLYDFSQSTITTDKVDDEYVEKPKRWDIGYIKRFMVSLGPVSSLFDFLTFFMMLFVFLPLIPLALFSPEQQNLFQTAWFIESLCSQVLVVFVIRTRRSPFWKSKPSKYLVISSVAIIAFALIVPFTPIGALFHLVPPPLLFYPALALLLGSYVALAEVVKYYFYKRNAYRLEQILVPKRTFYVTRTTELMQDIIAVISLRAEDEITIDSLIQDIRSAVAFPLNSKHVSRNIQYLRRSGLIAVNWKARTIKREKALDDYVKKSIMAGPTWSTVGQEWAKINAILSNRHGDVNAEYQDILPKQ